MPVEHCALSCKVQATLGKPGHGQRIDQVFLGMNPLRQAGWRVIRLYRYYCLYDQRATVEFLGDEVHAAAMLAITGFQSPLMGVQAFVFRQQGRVDIQQAAGVMTDETGGEDAHEAGQHHQLRIERIDGLDQRRVARR